MAVLFLNGPAMVESGNLDTLAARKPPSVQCNVGCGAAVPITSGHVANRRIQIERVTEDPGAILLAPRHCE